MNSKTISIGVVLAALISMPPLARGQQATEVYIPIGKSPGISVSRSYIGEIRQVDYAARSIEMLGKDGAKSINVNDKTTYYLDRSHYRKKSTTGEMSDCKVGRRIEANVSDDGTVVWIKIETE